MHNNDVGFVQFFMKQYNLAFSHFRKAFEENTRFIKSMPALEKCKRVKMYLKCVQYADLYHMFFSRSLYVHGERCSEDQ